MRVIAAVMEAVHYQNAREEETMRVAETGTRITLNNIVVATDFSPSADNALPYAGDLAARYGAKLYVVHAKTPVNYAEPAQAWQSTVDEAREIEMQELCKSLATSFPGVHTESVMGDGTAWDVLSTVLEKHSVDMIVVGTRGRTGWPPRPRWPFGSDVSAHR